MQIRVRWDIKLYIPRKTHLLGIRYQALYEKVITGFGIQLDLIHPVGSCSFFTFPLSHYSHLQSCYLLHPFVRSKSVLQTNSLVLPSVTTQFRSVGSSEAPSFVRLPSSRPHHELCCVLWLDRVCIHPPAPPLITDSHIPSLPWLRFWNYWNATKYLLSLNWFCIAVCLVLRW